MKKLLLLLIIPFLSFSQCIDGDWDNDGICDEIDDCIGTWIANITTGDCSQFTSNGADICNSYSGCEWQFSWGGWQDYGSDCVGTYELDNGDCNELDLGNTELCDSIFVSFIEYNELGEYIEIEVSTEFFTSYSYPYAGFILIDTQGDTVAAETLGTAGNVYGLSGGMLETRTLQVSNEFSLPFNGTIYLMNFLFAGSPELACSFPFYASDPLEENFCSQLNVTDVVVDDLNMTIDIAIYDGNVSGAPYPYIAYTIDDLGDTIQTGNINSFGNLGLDTSWYAYSLNSLPNYPLTIYYVYGMNVDTCILTYSSMPISIEESAFNKKLISTIDILGRESNNKAFQLHVYDDGSVEKKYLIK